MSRGQPIAAIRIQEAILDAIEAQTLKSRDGLTVRTDAARNHDPAIVTVEGVLDVQAIAIAVANLVNDR